MNFGRRNPVGARKCGCEQGFTNVAVADMIFVGYSCSAYLVTFTRSPVRDDVFLSGCMGNWLTIEVGYFGSLMLIALVTIESITLYVTLCDIGRLPGRVADKIARQFLDCWGDCRHSRLLEICWY